jgi:hypothetical protein
VDPRLHHLQGKAKLVKSTGMIELLRAFHRDKAALRHRHVASAEQVSHYDFNNTYQYIIAREDMHLRWLIDAITDLGGEPEEAAPPAARASDRERTSSGRSLPATATRPSGSSTSGGRRWTRSRMPATGSC